MVALGADREGLRKSGGVRRVGELAREYGLTDIDGWQPAPFEIERPASGAG